jgi:hypothetical protein
MVRHRTEIQAKVFLISLVLFVLLGTDGSAQTPAATSTAPVVRAESFYRTELYMGRSIPGGSMISDEAWEKFLGEVVTPLFPDGFTVLAGRGQYREASGVIAKEPSHVLVFLYRKADRKTARANIEKIRSEYKKLFAQESVLRVDITKSVLVSF